MINDILAAFRAEKPSPLQTDDAGLALAALLVRIAKSDEDYDPSEAAEITQILMARHGLSEKEAATLRQEAEILEAQAPDTVRFTKTLKNSVPYDDRKDIIRACWQVVLADGDRDSGENSFMRLVADLLGVTDVDSHIARRSLTP